MPALTYRQVTLEGSCGQGTLELVSRGRAFFRASFALPAKTLDTAYLRSRPTSFST